MMHPSKEKRYSQPGCRLRWETLGSISFESGRLSSPIASESDEAQFWLNGYVNKQNCRIWSESNPQVYVETPLHPEKLTVWCALWAGGILLQKR
ncbi:putative transposable element [Trichonephila clavipes]|nr:putative transposable element [Trichonephila clavipes]